jgi:hypothetical protein
MKFFGWEAVFVSISEYLTSSLNDVEGNLEQ